MDSYNRFNKCVFQWERSLFKLIGHDVFVGELKRNAISYTVYASAVLLVVTEIYTLMCYDDVFTKVFCLHVSLYTVQVGWFWTKYFLISPSKEKKKKIKKWFYFFKSHRVW